MLLEIRHLTQFLYDAPIHETVMELWMQPQKSGRQRLISFELELEPVAQLFSYADAFGNAVYHFDIPQPHEALAIQAKSAVETHPLPPLPDALDLGEWDRLRSDFIQGECFDFLNPSKVAAPSEALQAFIRAHDLELERIRRMDPLTAVRMLSEIIREALDYQSGVTEADSPIDHALKAGRGVCQDFAHIMIAICRGWGLPARYVSGYMHTDPAAGDRSNPSASHAWVEVFLPSLRWVGFDPANNAIAGERHVVVAAGRDYPDVPPTRGVFKGGALSELKVAVSVREARSAAAEPEFMRLSKPTFSRPGRRLGGAALGQQQQQQQQQ